MDENFVEDQTAYPVLIQLAACVEQVAAGDVGQVVSEGHLAQQADLDGIESGLNGGGKSLLVA